MTDQVTPFTDDDKTTATAESVTPKEDKPAGNEAPQFQIPDTVADLIGEGKKYADAATALSSIKPAQEHIERIERENAEMRAKMEELRKAEDVLADIKAASQQKQSPEGESKPQMSPEDIAAIVEQHLNATKAQEAAQANAKAVANAMTQAFGDKEKAEEMYVAKAEELGLGLQGLNSLAATSPKAVLAMFGLDKKEGAAPARSTGSVNTEAMNQQPAKQPPKSIMGGATMNEMREAWRALAEDN